MKHKYRDTVRVSACKLHVPRFLDSDLQLSSPPVPVTTVTWRISICQKSRRWDAKATALLTEITTVTRNVFHPFPGDPRVFHEIFGFLCL